jgi:hypothetical protein
MNMPPVLLKHIKYLNNMSTDPNYFTYCSEEEMFPYAFCYLNELYPKRDGWKLHFVRDEQMSWPDFVIEKEIGRSVKKVIVLVRMQDMIGNTQIAEMKDYEKTMRVKRNYQIEKVFIVPSGCDTSMVPEDIRIIHLKEFSLKSA